MSTATDLAPFEIDDAIDDAADDAVEPRPEIPEFEGKPVASATLKIAGGISGLPDDPNLVVGIDDRVRVAVVARVVEVKHIVDASTGELVRQQILKFVSADRIPFDPSDPDDDGILRG